MVFVEIINHNHHQFVEKIKQNGIVLSGRHNLRLVTHLDISDDDIEFIISKFKDYFRK